MRVKAWVSEVHRAALTESLGSLHYARKKKITVSLSKKPWGVVVAAGKNVGNALV